MTKSKKVNSGLARAKALTPERRKEIAYLGVEAKKMKKKLPKATHIGELIINNTVLNVSVLDNGQRIISAASVFKALDRPQRGYRRDEKRDSVFGNTDVAIPAFMDAKNLQPFVSEELIEHARKIDYLTSNNKISSGYDANILPCLCELYLTAREKGVITTSQQLETAKKAEILVRGLSRVGIVALVDEATGYQKDRAKDALAEILEKFVAKELRPWVKTFPTEYYEQLFRVWGQKFPPENINKRPSFMGTVTNNIIYSRLAPNLLEELKKAETKSEKKARLHQFLTEDIGHPKLKEHLASIITLLKISKDKDHFISLVDEVHPKYNNYETDCNDNEKK